GWGRGAEAKDLRSHRQDLAQLHRPYDWSRSAAGGSSGARWATWIRCNQRSFASAPRIHPRSGFLHSLSGWGYLVTVTVVVAVAGVAVSSAADTRTSPYTPPKRRSSLTSWRGA